MNEKEKEQGKNGSRAKIYTGDGYKAEERPEGAADKAKRRSEVLRTSGDQPKRRSEVLRESADRPKRRSEAVRASGDQPKRRSEVLRTSGDQPKRRSEILRESADRPKRRSEILREEEAKRQDEQPVSPVSKGQSSSARDENRKSRSETAEEQKIRTKKTGPESERPGIPSKEAPGQRSDPVNSGQEKLKKSKALKVPEKFQRLQKKMHVSEMSVRKKVFWGIGAVVAVVYISVAIYFGSHFYGGTTVYGIDCSRKTAAEVKTEIKDKLGDYTLKIQERENKSESITADQIDLQYEDDGSIEKLLKSQHSYIWPVMILLGRSKSSPVAFSYDIPLAKKSIKNLVCMDSTHMVAPHDAYISPTDTGYEVAMEVMGTTLDESRTQETILEALTDGETQLSLEEGNCYVNPTVFQDDETLQRDAQEMSRLASASITLDFGDTQEVVDASVIQKWITKMSNGEYVIDDVGVTEYVESLAAKYDTFGLPVEFYTSIGTTVTLSGGDYGWCIDQNATVIALLKALNEGYRGTMEPVYTYKGMSHENNGIGYTYVEICISRQEMWCYSDGNLVVDTPVVTGNPNKGNGTPAGGVWAIDAKQRNAVLVGEGYRSPVDYWMPFNGNIGIHDLQTRAYFGDTIYLYAGSHGCVNTPYEAVQMIYDVVSVGTPVIVYD